MTARNLQPRSTLPFQQLLADVLLWLALVLLFVAFRVTLFWIFGRHLSPHPSAHAFYRCLDTGLRSDTCVATWALLPTFALTLIGFVRPLGIWHQRVRQLTAVVVLTLCAAIFVVDVGYFAEYDNQFDHWIFGLVYDDLHAILTTIWKTYHVVALFLISGIALVLTVWALNKLIRITENAELPAFVGKKWSRAISLVVLGLWVLVGLRIWPGNYLVAVKNAGATGDIFLNKIVLNPFFALRYAIWQERNLQKTAGLRTILPDGDVRAAAEALFPKTINAPTVDDCAKRTAQGPIGAPPSDIFVVVMESYDAWPMEADYASLHLTDQLKMLGQNGVQVQAFLSAGASTIESLGTIITGLPYSRVMVNYQPAVRGGLPSAVANIFKRLGYRTRFFYGGFLSWERIGEFCREQGFDEVYGGDSVTPRTGGNEWGVDDEDLFRFVLAHAGTQPSFNLIMSTSYHPPYSVDLAKKGLDVNTLKANPICARLSQSDLRILGHLWYADKSVGQFVADAEQKLERPIFAITGDHFSRKKFVSVRPMQTLYDQLAVPLVIYGRKALEKVQSPSNLAASHLDILPTLIDLAAPSGFEYNAFGRDIFDASQPQLGFGCNAVIGPNAILRVHQPGHVEDLEGHPVSDVNGKELALHYRRLSALGWWRAMKGNEWPDDRRQRSEVTGQKSEDKPKGD